MPNTSEKLLLIDGYGQIYRAFFAIRGLTDGAGNPTNAVYGVARFLIALNSAYPCRYVAFVLDKGPPRERLDILPQYKANRPTMPDDLRRQIETIVEWVDACGIPILEKEGYEADDLIAGVASRKLAGRGSALETLIVSHDKDLGQLVENSRVRMLTPGKGGVFELLGEAEIETKFGVPPSMVRDWLALVGDSSDNIPGVPGIGAKTAARLLRQFGAVDPLLARLEEVANERLRHALTDHRQRLRDNLRLVSLMPEVPDDWQGLASVERREPDWQRLVDMAEKMAFKSLVKTLHDEREKWRRPMLNLF